MWYIHDWSNAATGENRISWEPFQLWLFSFKFIPAPQLRNYNCRSSIFCRIWLRGKFSPGNPTRAGPCVRALDFAEDLNDAALWCFRWRSLCRLTCVTTTNVLDRWDTHVVVYGFQANSVRLVKKIVTQKFSGHATRFQLFLLFSIQKYKLSLWLFSKVWILFPVTKLIFLLQVNQKATNQLTRVRRGSQRPTGQHLNIYFTQHKCCCMKHYLYWL